MFLSLSLSLSLECLQFFVCHVKSSVHWLAAIVSIVFEGCKPNICVRNSRTRNFFGRSFALLLYIRPSASPLLQQFSRHFHPHSIKSPKHQAPPIQSPPGPWDFIPINRATGGDAERGIAARCDLKLFFNEQMVTSGKEQSHLKVSYF